MSVDPFRPEDAAALLRQLATEDSGLSGTVISGATPWLRLRCIVLRQPSVVTHLSLSFSG